MRGNRALHFPMCGAQLFFYGANDQHVA